jgi:hypothetical protein
MPQTANDAPLRADERFGKRASRVVARRQPYGYGWEASDPTPDEVVQAEADEQRRENRIEALRAFQARPEYVIADQIRAMLEAPVPGENPFAALTLEEWIDLRNRLAAALREAQ